MAKFAVIYGDILNGTFGKLRELLKQIPSAHYHGLAPAGNLLFVTVPDGEEEATIALLQESGLSLRISRADTNGHIAL